MAANLLLIEPDTMLRRTMLRHLIQRGYGVRAVASAHEALAWMDGIKPDAVVLDCMTVGIHPASLITALHWHDRRLPIVLIAANVVRGCADLAPGASALIMPFRPSELVQRIEQAITDRAA